jgi:hypothetical protein
MALTLATVETAIEGLLTGCQSFTVDGQTYVQSSMDSLLKLRTQLKSEGGTGTTAAHPFGYRVRPLKPPEH